MSDFADQVSGIGLLAEPVRREIYLHVCAQIGPVSRDEVAGALDIPRHKAKFHLDKLEEEGLLGSQFARLTGRTGPGAGRPSKLYQRAAEEIAVSLPGRAYELAGQLLADAVATSTRTGQPAIEVLHREAAERGREWGQEAVGRAVATDALETARRVLAEHGYEPRDEGPRVVLANCPFHSLAASHTEMVCGMNHALINALVDEIDPGAVECRLEPEGGRCCVVLDRASDVN